MSAHSRKEPESLLQLSDEVSRIASTLARLSLGQPISKANDSAGVSHPEDLAKTLAQILRARRERAKDFPEEFFADPVWDMMLDLLRSEILQHRITVSSLCMAAAVPQTTALRWIKAMVDKGYFIRRADPSDGRRVFVELSRETSEALKRYFSRIGQLPVL